jgi:hypothetical protein
MSKMELNQIFRPTFRILFVLLVAIPSLYSCLVKNNSISKNSLSTQIENNLLKGAWGNNISGNADFAFYCDSIYYPDPNISYKYTIVKDTITIFVEDNKVLKILILKNTIDSLILNYQDPNIIMRYGKRK